MNDISDELISDAVKRTGFSLEFEVASVLKKLGGQVDSNVHLENHKAYVSFQNEESTIEVDLINIMYNQMCTSMHFIECKGTKRDNCLVLVKTDLNGRSDYYPAKIFDDKFGLDTSQNLIVNSGKGLIVSHTGDFFEKTTKNKDDILKQTSKNNSLYKGVCQLLDGISAYFQSPKYPSLTGIIELIPVIVTNCEINIVSFKNKDGYCIEKPEVSRKIKWTLFKNEQRYISGSIADNDWYDFGKMNPADYNSFLKLKDQSKNIPYIWIVNVEYLEEFIKSEDKTY